MPTTKRVLHQRQYLNFILMFIFFLAETSPTGSYVEDPKELERIESEKRKYEIMREHYKDDWLKALLADQGRLSVDKTEEQSKEAEEQSKETEEQSKETEVQSKEGGITKKPNESNETVIVTDYSKINTGKTEKEAKTETKQQAEKTGKSHFYCCIGSSAPDKHRHLTFLGSQNIP